MIGTTEVLIICGVVVLLFGASALPKFARNIGKARAEFRKGMKEARDATNDESTENISKTETDKTNSD